jgi:hypothetical protein
MATKTFPVTNYTITIGYEASGGGGGDRTRAYIVCFADDGHRFVIYFAAPGSQLAPPRYSVNAKFGSINVAVAEMHNYVDLLRNEKPVYAYLNSERPEWNNLSTSLEPVGEEEA